jgi:hypothetical protein
MHRKVYRNERYFVRRPSAGISAARHALRFSDTRQDSVRLDLGTVYKVTDSGANSDRSTKVGLCSVIPVIRPGVTINQVGRTLKVIKTSIRKKDRNVDIPYRSARRTRGPRGTGYLASDGARCIRFIIGTHAGTLPDNRWQTYCLGIAPSNGVSGVSEAVAAAFFLVTCWAVCISTAR